MKRLLSILTFLLAAVAPAAAQERESVTPDVAAFVDQELVLPGQTTELFLSGGFTSPFQLLGDDIDAVDRLANPGQWLLSVAINAPSSLNGVVTGLPASPGNFVAKGDVILFDAFDNAGAGSFSAFFCGVVAGTNISPGRQNYDIDALFLDGDELIVGFDAATDVITGAGTTTYEVGDLARFRKTGASCSSWEYLGPKFDAQGKLEANTQVLGAARTADGGIVFAFDRATCTCPPACPLSACPSPPTWKPQQLVKWNGATFTQAEMLLPGWPVSAVLVNALTLAPPTCSGMGNLNPDPGDVDLCTAGWKTSDGSFHDRLEWLPTAGVDSYRVYRGRFSEPPLQNLECLTIGGLEDTQFVDLDTPVAGEGFYYLVAEVIDGVQGTLGKKSSGEPRVITADPDCTP
jgi:hypothetical protein